MSKPNPVVGGHDGFLVAFKDYGGQLIILDVTETELIEMAQ